MSKRSLLLAALALLLAALATPAPTAARVTSVGDLWLDVSMGRPLLSWYNDFARPDDVARLDNLDELDLLDDVTAGRRMVVFKSVAEAERRLPALAGRLDIVGYNIEHGVLTPADEQADPVAAIRRLRILADEYNLPIALGPDRRFAVSHGPAMVPFADIFVFQVQRQQADHDAVRGLVLPLAPQLLRANPALSLTVQLRSEGNVVALVDLLETLKGTLDGVSLLTSPDSIEVATAFVTELRSRDPQPTPTRSRANADATRPAPISVPASDPPRTNSSLWPWILSGTLLAGALLGILVSARFTPTPPSTPTPALPTDDR